MDIRPISPGLSVAPQITPDDMKRLAADGYRMVISNRPDDEVGAELSSDAMRAAAQAAGIDFIHVPFWPGRMDAATLQGFVDAAAAAEGRVLAYCRSGTRSATLWALSQAGHQPATDILRAAAEAGYDLSHIAPLLASQT